MECQWFALCTNTATVCVTHPALGYVPCCGRCVDRFDMQARITHALDTSTADSDVVEFVEVQR